MEVELFNDEACFLQASESIADSARSKTGFFHYVLVRKAVRTFEELKDVYAGIWKYCSLHTNKSPCKNIKFSQLVRNNTNKFLQTAIFVRTRTNNMLQRRGLLC